MNEFEIKLLNTVAEHLSDPEMIHKLTVLSEFAWGFENWFQSETIIALFDSEIFGNVLGQKAFDADVVVRDGDKDIGVELRCWRKGLRSDNLERAFTEHPRADLYLFLFRNDDEKLSVLKEKLSD